MSLYNMMFGQNQAAPLDLADPLADLGALYAAAQDAHNRGDEFATVCMRLVERLAEVPITHQHQIEHLVAEVERLRSIEASWAELAEGYIAQRNDLPAGFPGGRRGGIAGGRGSGGGCVAPHGDQQG